MRSQLLVVAGLTCGALSLGGCGSGGSGTTAAGSSGGGAIRHSAAARSRPTRTYDVRLSGTLLTPPGAPHGTGAAIIAFHGDSSVCWRFAHLHGFTDATSARIQLAVDGRLGSVVRSLSRGPRLRHQGCVAINPTLTKSIWSQPGRYYVNIRSRQYPAGAVRAQL